MYVMQLTTMSLIVVLGVVGVILMTVMVCRDYNKANAERYKSLMCDPKVIGFAVIYGNHMRMVDGADPAHKSLAIVIQLNRATREWRVALTERRVYYSDKCHIRWVERRTKWHNKVFAPIINEVVDDLSGH